MSVDSVFVIDNKDNKGNKDETLEEAIRETLSIPGLIGVSTNSDLNDLIKTMDEGDVDTEQMYHVFHAIGLLAAKEVIDILAVNDAKKDFAKLMMLKIDEIREGFLDGLERAANPNTYEDS